MRKTLIRSEEYINKNFDNYVTKNFEKIRLIEMMVNPNSA